jgi:hypothetical protein
MKKPTERQRDMRSGTGIPRKVPEGRVLAHNHIRHTIDMLSGINGFRYWTWPKQLHPLPLRMVWPTALRKRSYEALSLREHEGAWA